MKMTPEEKLESDRKRLESTRKAYAKDWQLRGPDGTIYRFPNLGPWMRENRNLFGAMYSDPCHKSRAGQGIAKLAPWATDKYIEWNGWTWATSQLKPCACGCGKMVYGKFAHGHWITGTHQFGCRERGRLDHDAAKYWVVRDPAGRIYECTNLAEWVRKNISLFHDYHPNAKLPQMERVYRGLVSLGCASGSSCSYHGWVLVSVRELEESDGKDLLERRVA